MRTLIFLSVVVIASSAHGSEPAAPELGISAPKGSKKLVGNFIVGTRPNRLQEYAFDSDGMSWRLGVSPDGRVMYVGTGSPIFRTPDDISVGMRYSAVRSRVKRRASIVGDSGWAIALSSGWQAAFARGDGIRVAPLRSSTPVSFIFRRAE
jgi:hypothetical protein